MNAPTETSVSTNPDDLAALADELQSQLAPLEREGQSIEARIARLRRLIADLRGEAQIGAAHLFSPPAPEPVEARGGAVQAGGSPPGTQNAIVAVLKDANKPMAQAEIYAELERRNWLPSAAHPRNALRTSLWNMAEKGKIRKLGDTPAKRVWAIWSGTDPSNGVGAP